MVQAGYAAAGCYRSELTLLLLLLLLLLLMVVPVCHSPPAALAAVLAVWSTIL
jgi:hypothetical protein